MSEDVREDWLRPIEAVHVDGRAFRAHQRTGTGYEHSICWHDGKQLIWEFYDNGMPWPGLTDWRIRNVAQPAQEPRTAPSGGEVGAEVQHGIPPSLVTRMAEHLRECANVYGIRPKDTDAQRRYDEMKAIVALMPEPIDPDEAYADALLVEQGWDGAIDIGFAAVARMIATAHRAGRALQKEAGW